MRPLVSIMALVLPVLTVADGGAPRHTATLPVEVRFSQEKLDAIRARLTAQMAATQIAVRDEAEKAMRAPTAAEAEALALRMGGTEQIRTVAGGGVALKADGSHISAAVAHVESDGKVRVSYGDGVNHVR